MLQLLYTGQKVNIRETFLNHAASVKLYAEAAFIQPMEL